MSFIAVPPRTIGAPISILATLRAGPAGCQGRPVPLRTRYRPPNPHRRDQRRRAAAWRARAMMALRQSASAGAPVRLQARSASQIAGDAAASAAVGHKPSASVNARRRRKNTGGRAALAASLAAMPLVHRQPRPLQPLQVHERRRAARRPARRLRRSPAPARGRSSPRRPRSPRTARRRATGRRGRRRTPSPRRRSTRPPGPTYSASFSSSMRVEARSAPSCVASHASASASSGDAGSPDVSRIVCSQPAALLADSSRSPPLRRRSTSVRSVSATRGPAPPAPASRALARRAPPAPRAVAGIAGLAHPHHAPAAGQRQRRHLVGDAREARRASSSTTRNGSSVEPADRAHQRLGALADQAGIVAVQQHHADSRRDRAGKPRCAARQASSGALRGASWPACLSKKAASCIVIWSASACRPALLHRLDLQVGGKELVVDDIATPS